MRRIVLAIVIVAQLAALPGFAAAATAPASAPAAAGSVLSVPVDDGTLAVDRFDDDPTASACTEAPADCSLRGAIIQANADSATEEILVPAGTFTLSATGTGPTGGDLEVDHSTVITGAGSALTIVDANHASRAFFVSGGASPSARFPSLTGMTIRNGDSCAGDNAGNGGGIAVYAVMTFTDIVVEDSTSGTCGSGGGVYVGSDGSVLTLADSVVRDNTSALSAGAHVAGIHADGGLTIVDSTVSGNVAAAAPFTISTGGIYKGTWEYSGDDLEIIGSTVSSNVGATTGGIATGDDSGGVAVITIVNSTISGNSGGSYGGIRAKGPIGTVTHATITDNSGALIGGIRVEGVWEMTNTVIAANTGATPDCSISSGSAYTSGGGNLVWDLGIGAGQGDSFACPIDTGDLSGLTAGTPDAGLGDLADNGGPTWTHALVADSPAVDLGGLLACEAEDQRGGARPVGPGCDAGAYELGITDLTDPETTIDSGPAALTNSTTATFAFSADEPATFECSLDGVAFAVCISPLEFVGLADGSHDFAVRAIDLVLNVDTTPATAGWTVDTTVPETTISAGPPVLTNSTSATFSFFADGPATFECARHWGEFTPCVSPITYTGLLGWIHFYVRATSPAGSTDPTPAEWSWEIDISSPTPQITAKPAALTNSRTATYSFTANEPSTFRCSLDDAARSSCTSPKTYTDLASGQHTFTLEATDMAGNTRTVERSWSIDLSAPQTETTNVTPLAGGIYTPSTSMQLLYSADERSTFVCSLDGAAYAPCPGGTFSAGVKLITDLSDGRHEFRVKAKDLAGNFDPTAALKVFVVDTIAPDTAIHVAPPAASKLTSATFGWSATESSTYRCSLDGAAFQPCPGDGINYSDLAAGIHTFRVKAVDPAGNVDASPATLTWLIDTAAPVVTAPVSWIETGDVIGRLSVPVRIAWSGSDAGTWVVSFVLEQRIDGGPWTRVSEPSGAVTAQVVALPPGHTYQFRMQAVDRAHNASAWAVGKAFSLGLAQETAATPTGAWTSVTTSSASGGTYRYSSDLGSSVTYAFTGRSIAWIAPKMEAGGSAMVFIDGFQAATIDLSAATTTHRVAVFTRTWASVGAHTIKIQVTPGTPGHRRVSIDAFVVFS